MNWVLILVLLILLYHIIHGYHKGFLRIVYSLAAWIVVLAFVIWSKPYINNFFMEHTTLNEKMEGHFEEKIRENAEGKTEEEMISQGDALTALGIHLPDAAMERLVEMTTKAADELLESSGVYAQMAKGMANFIVEGISFIIALIGAWFVVHIISQILGIVSKIPVLKGVNRFFGLFAGGFYGLILVWVAFYIVAICSTSEMGTVIISYIHESEFLEFLYENNLVLTIILHYL